MLTSELYRVRFLLLPVDGPSSLLLLKLVTIPKPKLQPKRQQPRVLNTSDAPSRPLVMSLALRKMSLKMRPRVKRERRARRARKEARK